MFHHHRLNLRGFLRQHFHYGRGAWRYYTTDALSVHFESPRLYLSLLLAPFRAQHNRTCDSDIRIGAAGAICYRRWIVGPGLASRTRQAEASRIGRFGRRARQFREERELAPGIGRCRALRILGQPRMLFGP